MNSHICALSGLSSARMVLKDNRSVQDGNPRSRSRHSRNALFTECTITTQPQRTQCLACLVNAQQWQCAAHVVEMSLCALLLAVTDERKKKKGGGGKKAKTDKTYKTIIPHSLHSWHIFWEAISCKNSDTGIMMALIGPHLTGGTSCSFVLVSLWEDGVGGGWSGRGRVWGKQLLEMTQSRTSLWPPTLAHNAHTFAHITTSHIGRPVNVGACRFFCWWPS